MADHKSVDALPPPSLCPSCRSQDISTTSKNPADTSSYWRCAACGEIWNAERLQHATRQGSRGGWRRY